MKPYQRIAFQNPCYVAEDTVKPAFKRYGRVNGRLLSIILTANFGFE